MWKRQTSEPRLVQTGEYCASEHERDCVCRGPGKRKGNPQVFLRVTLAAEGGTVSPSASRLHHQSDTVSTSSESGGVAGPQKEGKGGTARDLWKVTSLVQISVHMVSSQRRLP